MNYHTRQQWFDSVWPVYDNGNRILIPVNANTDFEEIDRTAQGEKDSRFMLVIEDFDHFSDNMPNTWRRMDSLGGGGIPPNIWVGASVMHQQEADKRMKRLVKIKARVLFLLLKKGHDKKIDLKAGLIAYRCSNCGTRGGYGRMNRPTKCGQGTICEGAGLNPQIHWVVSMDPYENNSGRAARCKRLGVAFWDGESIEVPE
jgi:hypothetical protein